MSTIEESQLSNKDLAPTGPGVFVAFGLSALAYVGLMRGQSTAREPATAAAE